MTLTDQTFEVERFDGSAAILDMTLSRDGNYSAAGRSGGPSYPIAGQYYVGSVGNVGDVLWARLTLTEGDPPTAGAALGAWLPLSSNRTWTWAAFEEVLSFTGTLEISYDALGTAVLASATVEAICVSISVPDA